MSDLHQEPVRRQWNADIEGGTTSATYCTDSGQPTGTAARSNQNQQQVALQASPPSNTPHEPQSFGTHAVIAGSQQSLVKEALPRSEELLAMLSRAENENRRLKGENQQLKDDIYQARQHEKEAEERLQSLKAGMAAVRAYGEIEKMDGQDFIALFDGFVDAVSDFAFDLFTKLGGDVQTASVAPDSFNRLETANAWAADRLKQFLEQMNKKSAKVRVIVVPVMQSITFSLLAHFVFRPASLAGLHIQGVLHKLQSPQYLEKNPRYLQENLPYVLENLQYLQDRVATHVPQEKYGRWRAITYGAIRVTKDDTEVAREASEWILKTIYDVVTALLPRSAKRDEALRLVFESYKVLVIKIVLDAIKLQDTMQRVYVSYDYTLFLSKRGECYSDSSMEEFDLGLDDVQANPMVAGQPVATGNVLLLVAPGLRATRVEENLSRSNIFVKKASVVVGCMGS